MKKKLTEEEKEIERKKNIIFYGYCIVVLALVVGWIVENEIKFGWVLLGTIFVGYYWVFFLVVVGGIGWIISEFLYKYYEEISVIIMFIGMVLFSLLLLWIFTNQNSQY